MVTLQAFWPLFIALVLVLLVIWAVPRLTAAFGTPAPIAQLIFVIVVILAVLYILAALSGLVTGGVVPRLPR